jgi:hypothetical protein
MWRTSDQVLPHYGVCLPVSLRAKLSLINFPSCRLIDFKSLSAARPMIAMAASLAVTPLAPAAIKYPRRSGTSSPAAP